MSLSDWSNVLRDAHRNGHRVWFACQNEKPSGPTFRFEKMLRHPDDPSSKLMTEAQADDCVVHVKTTRRERTIVGMSIVRGRCKKVTLKGNAIVRQIPIGNFEHTEISLDGFIEENRKRLRRIIETDNPINFPFRRHNKDSVALLRRYFTEATSQGRSVL